DTLRAVCELDRDNALGLRAKYRSQVIAALQAENTALYNKLLAEARVLRAKEDWQGAIEKWSALPEELPSALAAAAYLERARAYVVLGKFDCAAADFGRAQALQDSNDLNVWLQQVYTLVQIGDVQGYRRVCSRLVEKHRGTTDLTSAFLVA